MKTLKDVKVGKPRWLSACMVKVPSSAASWTWD